MLYITAVHMAGGTGHQHIAEHWWLNAADGKTGKTDTAGMVKFVNDNPGSVKVGSANGPVSVFVVDANPPYLRTGADKQWTDNLLALPRY